MINSNMQAFVQKYGTICKPEMIIEQWNAIKAKWNLVAPTLLEEKSGSQTQRYIPTKTF